MLCQFSVQVETVGLSVKSCACGFAGVNGMSADTSAAIHAINARLGLDSSLGLFGMGATSRAYQSLDGGPRSISMGALGQNRQAFFGGANNTPSFGAISTGTTSQAAAAQQQQQAMNKAMTQAMLSQLVATNQAATANGRVSPKVDLAAPAISMEAAAAHAPQEVSKGALPGFLWYSKVPFLMEEHARQGTTWHVSV